MPRNGLRRPPAWKAGECPWVSSDPDVNSAEWERARKVREAMLISIDRQEIVDTLLGGEGAPQSLWVWENRQAELGPRSAGVGVQPGTGPPASG